ncbi:CPBP family intramembrane glutamic endopeptidase [Cecembia rubra]|uniref:CPBP family intramembrane glutamic endopeptidase n=1 Tax=Cecembia rubra TaxID=1485585 RepID=UPI002714F073|nr:CPBP family intramembrane glutamic endopeptidase [Cecembia rubra]
MQIYKTQAPIASKRSWFLSLMGMLLITIGVMIVLQFIGIFLIPPIFQIPLDETVGLFTGESDHPKAKYALFFVQAIGAGFAFLASAWLIAKVLDKADFGWKQQMSRFKFKGLIILLMIMFGGVVFNSIIIDWNANVEFPESWSFVEEWMKEAEAQRIVLTKFLTDFNSPLEFLIGILVIGFIAGIGEEVFFRGVLQSKMHIYTGNIHLSVWISAFIFSAIHIQFYGLFPRMVLGAIFGYIYFYSGSMIYPIIAHILNNSLTVTLVYLGKLGIIEFDIEKTDQVSWPFAMLGLVLLLIAMKAFKDSNKNFKLDDELAESL